MRREHFSRSGKLFCYSAGFELILELSRKEILRGWKKFFPVTLIKSYFHFVRRVCGGSECYTKYGNCSECGLSCWQSLSVNLKKEVEGILEMLPKPIPIP